MKVKYDFSGYATKHNLKCSDGRTILTGAFKHHDGNTVPLVWQHMHNDPGNILGHAILENRDDGVYAYGKFNESPAGLNAKELVKHGDITALSIYANNLKEKNRQVQHGMIREVSLVLSGANPEALIDNLCITHADGSLTGEYDETEAIIYTGEELVSTGEVLHEDSEEAEEEVPAEEETKPVEHADSDATVRSIFDSMTEEQKTAVYAMMGGLMGSPTAGISHSNKEEDETMKTNVFDAATQNAGPVLTHSQISEIMTGAMSDKPESLKDYVMQHAATYGIENIEILFPEAQTLRNTPDWVKREDAWVTSFLAGVHKSPFSRIKSRYADITEDEARAKGYLKTNEKFEEVFPVFERTTTPYTIYKKQKLDRDDIIDITDFDVVAWIRGEMRGMLNEEIARAALVGDGRLNTDPDKIKEDHIRPIWKDDDLYSHKVQIPATRTVLDMIDDIVRARKNYKGSGNPTLFTTVDVVTEMLLVRDTTNRKIYPTMAELKAALRVSNIVEVEVMEGLSRTTGTEADEVTLDLIGILVNLSDYTIGADKGGQVAMFDDFDIDFNQYKYLIETRCSGTLTKPKSAVVIEKIRSAG